jgi:opacity protein-like surface antigen
MIQSFLVLGALISTTALAEGISGFYFGADAAGIDATSGRSHGLLVGTPDGVFSVLPEAATVTGTDVGWGLQGGYRINRYLALEAGYMDFGSMVVHQIYDLSMIGIPELEHLVDFAASGFSLSWMAHIPLGEKFGAFVRAGALHAEQEIRSRLRAVLPGESAIEKASEIVPLLGTGLTYRTGKDWSVRLEYQYLDGLNGGETPSVDTVGPIRIRRFALGIAYRF